MTKEMKELIVKREQHQTSHGLHLVATFLTGGLWAFVWGLMWLGNRAIRRECDEEIKKLEKEMLNNEV